MLKRNGSRNDDSSNDIDSDAALNRSNHSLAVKIVVLVAV